MAGFRQHLAGMIAAATAQAVERNDQQYGRQLATVFERSALVLRAALGGKPLWHLRPITAEDEVFCTPCMDERNVVVALPAGTKVCPACGSSDVS